MMTLTTQNLVYGRELVRRWLAALQARPADTLLGAFQVILFSDETQPTPDTDPADFTPCAFSGYAPATPSLSGVIRVSAEQEGVVASITWIATTATPFVPDMANGYMVLDEAGAVMFAGEKFAAAVPFAAVGDALILNLILPLDFDQIVNV